MVSNVGAATAAVFFLVPFLTWLARGNTGTAIVAAGLAATAAWVNPRSAIALASATAAVCFVSLLRGVMPRQVASRTMIVAAGAALLSAPEWLSLLRFGDLYHFIHFTRYSDAREFLSASVASVSAPVFAAAWIGLLSAFRRAAGPVTQCAAAAIVIHVLATLVVIYTGAVPQLEATRLMPFQRFLTIYLAGVGVHKLAGVVANWVRPEDRASASHVRSALAVSTLALAVVATPLRDVTTSWDALPFADTTARAEMPDFTEAVHAADRAAAKSTAVLALGSTVSIHQPLWAPAVRDRAYYYDDWLWDWHTSHAGPHDQRALHAYPVATWSVVLSQVHLARHGVGAVVVTGAARPLAAGSEGLKPVHTGKWFDVYAVTQPAALVTWPGAIPDIIASNHRVTANGTSDGGSALIRRNWHPRWQASVNGRAARVERRSDGYMEVAVIKGWNEIQLLYVLDAWDRIGRACVLLGLIGLLGTWPSRIAA
jgi:hypothetical protein